MGNRKRWRGGGGDIQLKFQLVEVTFQATNYYVLSISALTEDCQTSLTEVLRSRIVRVYTLRIPQFVTFGMKILHGRPKLYSLVLAQ